MAFINQTKNSSTVSNQSKGATLSGLTWNEATFTWDEASETTWDTPNIPFINQTKNSSSVTNQAKN